MKKAKKVKMWKGTVHNWGWDAPRSFYFPTKEEAEAFCDRYPAADKVVSVYVPADQEKELLMDTWYSQACPW